MQTGRVWKPLVVLLVLFSPFAVLAEAYTVTVKGERLEYVAQPQRGYVVKLPQKAGGISALSVFSLPDAEDAQPIRGRDRRGIWTVENDGPAIKNRQMMLTLRQQARAAYVAPLFSSNSETVAIIPEIVVRVRPGIEMDEVQTLCETAGCTIRNRMEFTTQAYLLDVLGPDADGVFAAVEMLNHCPEVEWACPNTASQPKLCGQITPNDEYFPMQWHLHNTGQSGGTPDADISAAEAREITTGDPNIIVAVVDSGVDTNHPDLIHNLVSGYDFLESDDLPDPALDYWGNAHGTACAGLIAAQGNNSIGVSGVAWNCKMMPIRISRSESPEKEYFITEADIASALRWAATHGADVLSNSWGWLKTPTPSIHSAIIDITEVGGMGRDGKGCVVLFAGGNQGEPMGDYYPRRYPEVIAVGATDHDDVRWYYSNYGPELDVVAPSGGHSDEDVLANMGRDYAWTTDISGIAGYSELHGLYGVYTEILDYSANGGTSSACPVAAGVAALILSIEPNLISAEVRHFLERSAEDLGDPGRDDYYGWGRVDARAALDMVLAKRADLNNDWRVGLEDLVVLIESWESNDPVADIAPPTKRDGFVDEQDVALMMQYWEVVIPEMGLVTHWKLDETEGTIAFDSEGDYDATVMGLPLWQPEGGMIGGALQFSGMPNFAMAETVRDPSEGPLSIFAWIKGGAPGQVVISQQTGVNWLLADPATGALTTELRSSGRQSKALYSDAVITDNNWHRVGFTWDGSSRRLYVNDVLVAEDTDVGLAGSIGDLLIGCGSTMIPTTFFSGLIDDVRVYKRALKP